MKHLAYEHQRNVSLIGASWRLLRRMVPGRLKPSPGLAGWPWCRRYVLSAAGIILALVIQFALIWLVAEIVQVAHGLMELWLELATQHLDLLSLYNSVRPK